jgi:Set1/Ash2 histone methyltransferase complex subunit ASH2
MVRASAGVDSGCWYYEVEVLPPPSVQEVVKALPRNVRFGKKLKVGLREGMVNEEMEKERVAAAAAALAADNSKEEEESMSKAKRRRIENEPAPDDHSVGGHVRMGWSMRTGELQAPVGYDRWSYGYRDVLGSRVHNSKREDRWGGVSFGPGDVIGFAICLVGPENKAPNAMEEDGAATKKVGAAAAKAATATNHIRFFKNGEAIGNFIVSRGVRIGGAAFDNIQSGTYYPAISSYMGGSARANFGPHFMHPPRGLPSGMKVRPMCDMCPPPISAEEALTLFKKEKVFGKKVDETLVNTFYGAVRLEATIRVEAYENHQELHVEEVRQARNDRGLSTSDLPPPPEIMQE